MSVQGWVARALSLTTSQTTAPLLTRLLLDCSFRFLIPPSFLVLVWPLEGNSTLQGTSFFHTQPRQERQPLLPPHHGLAVRAFCRLRRLLLIVCACCFLFRVVPALQGISFCYWQSVSFSSSLHISLLSLSQFNPFLILYLSFLFNFLCFPYPPSHRRFLLRCVYLLLFVCFSLDQRVQVEKGRSGNSPIYPNQEGTIASSTTSLIALVSWPQPTSLALAKGRRTSDNRTSSKPYPYLFFPAQSHLGLAFTSLLTHLTHHPSGLVVRPLPVVTSCHFLASVCVCFAPSSSHPLVLEPSRPVATACP